MVVAGQGSCQLVGQDVHLGEVRGGDQSGQITLAPFIKKVGPLRIRKGLSIRRKEKRVGRRRGERRGDRGCRRGVSGGARVMVVVVVVVVEAS